MDKFKITQAGHSEVSDSSRSSPIVSRIRYNSSSNSVRWRGLFKTRPFNTLTMLMCREDAVDPSIVKPGSHPRHETLQFKVLKRSFDALDRRFVSVVGGCTEMKPQTSVQEGQL